MDLTCKVIKIGFRNIIVIDDTGREIEVEKNEVSYEWIDDLRKIFYPGQMVKVKIIAQRPNRLMGSIKALQQKPSVPENVKSKEIVKGKVVSKKNNNLFVELAPGIFTSLQIRGQLSYKIGDQIFVYILHVNYHNNKIVSRVVDIS